MNYRIIFALLLMAIVLTGCTGQSATTNQNQQTAQATGQTVQQTTTTTQQTATQQISNLVGKGWAELVGLNVPIECKVTYKGKAANDAIKNAVLYMKGNKFKEVVTMTAEGMTLGITVISKDDGNIYMMYDDPTMMTAMTQGKIKCDGMVYSTETNMAQSADSATVDTSVLQSSDYVNLDCKPALFGDEMFATPGKLCTLKEITNALTGGQNTCESITDPQQKKDCEAILGN